MFLAAAALIVAGVALFVAAPLGGGLIGAKRKSTDELGLERHRHERGHAVQALRELEFDREMGKLSEADYEAMRAVLETRALAAMTAIEKIRAAQSKPLERPALEKKVEAPHLAPVRPPAPAPPQVTFSTSTTRRMDSPSPFSRNAPAAGAAAQRSRLRFCPQCGTRAAAEAKFCADCGLALRAVAPASNWND